MMNGIGNQSRTVLTATQAAEDAAPRVSRLMGGVQNALSANDEIVSTLTQRLHAVLLPSPPQADATQGKAMRDSASPLSGDLESFKERLYATNAHLTDILNRLEI